LPDHPKGFDPCAPHTRPPMMGVAPSATFRYLPAHPSEWPAEVYGAAPAQQQPWHGHTGEELAGYIRLMLPKKVMR